jgi:hypothetical protein
MALLVLLWDLPLGVYLARAIEADGWAWRLAPLLCGVGLGYWLWKDWITQSTQENDGTHVSRQSNPWRYWRRMILQFVLYALSVVSQFATPLDH